MAPRDPKTIAGLRWCFEISAGDYETSGNLVTRLINGAGTGIGYDCTLTAGTNGVQDNGLKSPSGKPILDCVGGGGVRQGPDADPPAVGGPVTAFAFVRPTNLPTNTSTIIGTWSIGKGACVDILAGSGILRMRAEKSVGTGMTLVNNDAIVLALVYDGVNSFAERHTISGSGPYTIVKDVSATLDTGVVTSYRITMFTNTNGALAFVGNAGNLYHFDALLNEGERDGVAEWILTEYGYLSGGTPPPDAPAPDGSGLSLALNARI